MLTSHSKSFVVFIQFITDRFKNKNTGKSTGAQQLKRRRQRDDSPGYVPKKKKKTLLDDEIYFREEIHSKQPEVVLQEPRTTTGN